jgi:hypothetical protein
VFNCIRGIRACATGSIVLAFLLLLAPSTPASAGTGTVHFTFAKAGLLVGVGGATGTLHFHGHNYPLRVRGVSFGTMGFGITKLKGHAYNLRYAADIVGTYSAVSVSAAVAGGKKVARLRNSNDVVYLHLEGAEAGLELTAAVSGMTISLR